MLFGVTYLFPASWLLWCGFSARLLFYVVCLAAACGLLGGDLCLACLFTVCCVMGLVVWQYLLWLFALVVWISFGGVFGYCCLSDCWFGCGCLCLAMCLLLFVLRVGLFCGWVVVMPW